MGTFSLKFDDDYARLSDDHTLTMAEVSSWVSKLAGTKLASRDTK